MTYTGLEKEFYIGSVRFSRRAGNSITYKFSGKSVALIATKGPNRSRAAIYVDGRYIKTIDAFSAGVKFRQSVFSRSWSGPGIHYLKIVNEATRGRSLFDIDALAVGR